VKTRPVYGPGSPHNELLDMFLVRGITPPLASLSDRPGLTADEARSRLAQSAEWRTEQRTANLELSLSHQGSDYNLGASGHLNDAMTDSYVTERVIAPLFTSHELPEGTGNTIKIPRLTTSVTVGVAGLDVATTPTGTPVSAIVTAPVAMVSGLVLASWQWMDLCLQPGAEAIAGRILGARFAESLDAQLYGGSGTTGQTVGLNKGTGATTAAYTDATPSVQEALTVLAKLRSTTSTARKARVDTIIMHNRRMSWLLDGNASTNVSGPVGITSGDDASNDFAIHGMRVVEYAGVGTAQGAGTEDSILIARSSDLDYWQSAPEIDVYEDFSGVTSAQVGIVVKGYVASPGGLRQAAGIGTSNGTGWIAPSGF
jgi:hypothetical protein